MTEAAKKPLSLPTDPNTLVDEQFVADYYGVAARTVKLWRYKGRGPKYIRQSSTVIRYQWGDILAHNQTRSAMSTAEETAAATAA